MSVARGALQRLLANQELRRVVLFLAVGGIQFAFDSGLFILLTYWGAAPSWCNVLTRFSAAMLGFLLNGKLTFGQARLTRGQLLRYVLLWVGLTVLSTGSVVLAGNMAGMRAAWSMKVGAEILLALLSYVLMRRWVFAGNR